MNPVLPSLFALLASFVIPLTAFSAEPFLKPGDVIALVGGEDMVAASEYGYLELLLTRALPDYRLKFRNLAWEGDTVFEQRRDLNFPPLEAQLDAIGATVVLCQFGQMESLAGKEKLPEFVAAYEKLIERMSGGGKRKVMLIPPEPTRGATAAYADAVRALQPGGLTDISPGQRPGSGTDKKIHPGGVAELSPAPSGADSIAGREPRVSPGANVHQPSGLNVAETRDGIHLSPLGLFKQAFESAVVLVTFRVAAKAAVVTPEGDTQMAGIPEVRASGALASPTHEPLRQLIIAKNRLWFDYWRPQNWAFLAGDRTSQPSSRDHLDPTKRWFPAEREAFLPLIAAKEEAIWKLAAELK